MKDSRVETYEHIQKVQENLASVIQNLSYRSLTHDRSKLIDPEKTAFDNAKALREVEYNTPEYEEAKKSLGSALFHHYVHNDHHPEYYVRPWLWEEQVLDEERVKSGEAIGAMNLVALIEMLADWVAATERMADGDIRKSIESNQERFGYSDELKNILHNTVTYMGWDTRDIPY